VHTSAHLAPASHLADFALQPAQLRLSTCTPRGSPTCHTCWRIKHHDPFHSTAHYDVPSLQFPIVDAAGCCNVVLHIEMFLPCMQIAQLQMLLNVMNDIVLHVLMFLLCMQIAQLRTLLNVMNDIVRKCNGNALGMVMGDFNSTPQSAVYQFIKAGELDCQTVPRKHVSGQVQGTSWPAALEKVIPSHPLP